MYPRPKLEPKEWKIKTLLHLPHSALVSLQHSCRLQILRAPELHRSILRGARNQHVVRRNSDTVDVLVVSADAASCRFEQRGRGFPSTRLVLGACCCRDRIFDVCFFLFASVYVVFVVIWTRGETREENEDENMDVYKIRKGRRNER